MAYTIPHLRVYTFILDPNQILKGPSAPPQDMATHCSVDFNLPSTHRMDTTTQSGGDPFTSPNMPASSIGVGKKHTNRIMQ